MWERFLSLESRRKRLLKRTPGGPLREFLGVPFPAPESDCRGVEYVALDLETTGLDPQTDEIISIGLVCLFGTRIDLASAQHRVVTTVQEIPEQSAVIHRLLDDRVAAGEALPQVLEQLLGLLAGRVLIAHHARVEQQFLSRACERLFGGPLLLPIVDTQWIAKKWLERRNRVYGFKELRLAALREAYGLPRYHAHNALSDALAAAELYLAQIAERENEKELPLKAFLYKI